MKKRTPAMAMTFQTLVLLSVLAVVVAMAVMALNGMPPLVEPPGI